MSLYKNLIYLCCFLVFLGNVFYGGGRTLNEIKSNRMKCASLLDLTILLDASGSVGLRNWRNVVIPFVQEVIKNLDIGVNNVHTALATYDNVPASIKWKLDNEANYNKDNLKRAVERLKNFYTGKATYTGKALKLLEKEVIFGPGHRKDAPKLLILVTDGNANDHVDTPAKVLRDKGVTIMVVGVANAVASQCRSMAGCNKYFGTCNLYKSAHWGSLVGEVNNIIKTACETLPKDAICNEWSDWSPCSTTCGEGSQTRYVQRPVTIAPAEPGDNKKMGRTCEELYPETTEIKRCFLKECPIDAGCGELGEWTECSRSCGGGTRSRHRTNLNKPPAQHGGRDCEQQQIAITVVEECNTDPCPIDAIAGEWEEWSACSKTCGWGQRTRKRKAIVEAQYKGKTLEQQKITTKEEEYCKYFDCGPCVSYWAAWTECTSKVCGKGIKSRHRAVKFDYPDHKCPDETYETSSCDTDKCEEPVVPEVDQEKIEEGTSEQERHEEETNEVEPIRKEEGGGTNGEEGRRETSSGEGNGEESGPSRTNTIAAIAGGVIGGLALLGALGAGGYYYFNGEHGAGVVPEGEASAIEQQAEVEEQEVAVDIDAESEAWQ